MSTLTQVFAIVAGVIHVLIFAMESVLFGRPAIQRTFLGSAPSSPQLKLFAFNQGFYNLFLAIGAIGGVIAAGTGGSAVALFCCGCMVAAGVVLIASSARLWRGALVQIVPAGIALLAALLN
jgi:putative membrane protein